MQAILSDLTLPIIGYHRSPLSQKFGTPRQPNLVNIKSVIEFVAPFDTPDAFLGIENYSHLWVLWQFHHNKAQTYFRPQVRPPRLGGNDKMGVFATRSMYRPSQIGLSVVALKSVQVIDQKVILHIVGADMIDGTPIIDVKPYLPYSDSLPHAISMIDKPSIKQVQIAKQAQIQFDGLLQVNAITQEDIDSVIGLIAQDPRPAYRQHETDIVSTMRYKTVDVDFMMNKCGEMVVGNIRVIK
ncbi:tRNA (N6-threonylcarbamoyladenosine(37)-N6)-methyltransferase TrmO [Moraxella nasovis]|uniref:tRNA (N6-threonylcarbamoyladenosine(37)-N6)-methyltransferase TrmO n=1 Tax=Moraxella nasovis TaxID=2904121 RepID=UPI001F5FFBA0|nr:tRNA (N6-threonylcarbamoyladenosine(37)-N6)-methyltransferase TrmO [Moraxella nasovis]UNU73228.1 tRNA (N6-threonylcarbamoyladenosine(37)-N6)-methyltransferase TrmO [Moraxella nasovis]